MTTTDPTSTSTLFELLPIGAYRSLRSGHQLRANQALVKLAGFESEAELLATVQDIGQEWYVDPKRRQHFIDLIERDGSVIDFVSEVYRHKTRERIWVRENAHVIRSAEGEVLCYEGTVEDITATHQALLSLQAQEAHLRSVTAQVPGMLYQMAYRMDGSRHFTFVSAGIRALFGVEPEAAMADADILSKLRHPDDQAWVSEQFQQSALDAVPQSICYRVVLADGTLKWVQVTSSPLVSTPDGGVRNGVIFDITDLKRAEAELHENEERWKLALDSTGDGVWDWHIQAGREYYSKRYKEMYGYEQDKVWQPEDGYTELVHPDDKVQLIRDQQAYFNGETTTYSNEHRVRCKDGSWKWVLTRGMIISRDAQGQPLRMIGTHTDITDRKTAEAQVWQQANFDPLTGLPNRRNLRSRLRDDIERCARLGQRLAILFIDLDHFKEINDTLGHDNGDQLLVQAAQRIQACLGSADTVARMGGDEYTVIVNQVQDNATLAPLLQAILDALSAVYQLNTEQVFVSASLGVALYPADGTQVEDLFKHADQALYVAKGAGRNRYSFFTPALQEEARARARLTHDLRFGLARSELAVHYQPIVHLPTGRVHKAEALLRWQHPTLGQVSPAQFIGLAESSGQIIGIGEWVFHQAAAQVAAWRQRFEDDFQISVNKSPVQFHHDSLPSHNHHGWVAYLQSLGLPGNAIAVEITEGVLLRASDSVTQQLRALREGGAAVSLDDFGTGYSSMTYLQRFAIDFIKIDQSFVRNLKPGAVDLALCKAIIVMAHELGMQVVAEGVETPEQSALLTAAGCDYGQGYLFAKPMRVSDFEAWMRAECTH